MTFAYYILFGNVYTLCITNTPHSDQKLNYQVRTPVTPFSLTTRHTVTKTELFSWDFGLCASSCKECTNDASIMPQRIYGNLELGTWLSEIKTMLIIAIVL